MDDVAGCADARAEAMRTFRDLHAGKRCWILGNGPSLRGSLETVRASGDKLLGSNRIYLSGTTPDYYACVNPLVFEQFYQEIGELDCVKFIGEAALERAPKGWNKRGWCVPIDTSLNVPAFGNPEGVIWEGYTVTYVLLQLAYYMGFIEAGLVGMDHDYGMFESIPNMEVTSQEGDRYHFSDEYFGQGVKWNAPDLVMSELAYTLAKEQWEGEGRRVVNCSEHTRLRVFPLMSVRRLRFGGQRVSALVSAYKCPAGWVTDTVMDLRRQSEPPEVVVVCQAGSEQEQAAVDAMADQVITTEDIPTIYRAWNLAAKAARGKYLTSANTDDRRHRMACETLADILDARPGVDVVYADQFITWEKPMDYEQFTEENAGKELVLGRYEGQPGMWMWGEYSRGRLGQGCFLGSQPMWRASLHQLYGGFAEHLTIAGDYEFWLRVSREDNILHVGYPLGVYCARTGGAEMSNLKVSEEESEAAMMLHQEATGLEVSHRGKMVRLTLGGKWVFVDSTELVRALNH